jgi:hypothetical protein
VVCSGGSAYGTLAEWFKLDVLDVIEYVDTSPMVMIRIKLQGYRRRSPGSFLIQIQNAYVAFSGLPATPACCGTHAQGLAGSCGPLAAPEGRRSFVPRQEGMGHPSGPEGPAPGLDDAGRMGPLPAQPQLQPTRRGEAVALNTDFLRA